MKKTAKYKGVLIYVAHMTLDYVLVSYDESLIKQFKINISELTDIKFELLQNNY
jgi:hypothetical protein